MIEHGGAWISYRAQVSRFPERRLTVVFLSNASSIGVAVSSIADLLPGVVPATPEPQSSESEAPSTIDLPLDALAEYEGTYWSDELERELRLESEDGGIQLGWADDVFECRRCRSDLTTSWRGSSLRFPGIRKTCGFCSSETIPIR
ncbi:MAG: hypothetical protein WBO54_14000 [Thermoanaerobaculia bacterium]